MVGDCVSITPSLNAPTLPPRGFTWEGQRVEMRKIGTVIEENEVSEVIEENGVSEVSEVIATNAVTIVVIVDMTGATVVIVVVVVVVVGIITAGAMVRIHQGGCVFYLMPILLCFRSQ